MKKLLLFEMGETIIEEGDVGESAYLIEEGVVEVSRSVDGHRVILASLGVDGIFGEMSMIDDCPRGATVTATTATTVSEIHRSEFLEHLQSEPEFAIRFLRTIFERLRTANNRVLQLEQSSGAAAADGDATASREPPRNDRQPAVTLEGLTPQAREALPENPCRFDRLPILVGRMCQDPLVFNDLNIVDDRPWQISRHHLKLVVDEGKVCAVDRGSTLGSLVDGQALGGRNGPAGPVVFNEPEGLLVLGIESSPYQYKVRIEEA